jgi:hypothetical protein
VPEPAIKNGWPVAVYSTSLRRRHVNPNQISSPRTTRASAPRHPDAVAQHRDKVRRDVRHGRVRVGEQHIVGDLDRARDAAGGNRGQEEKGGERPNGTRDAHQQPARRGKRRGSVPRHGQRAWGMQILLVRLLRTIQGRVSHPRPIRHIRRSGARTCLNFCSDAMSDRSPQLRVPSKADARSTREGEGDGSDVGPPD